GINRVALDAVELEKIVECRGGKAGLQLRSRRQIDRPALRIQVPRENLCLAPAAVAGLLLDVDFDLAVAERYPRVEAGLLVVTQDGDIRELDDLELSWIFARFADRKRGIRDVLPGRSVRQDRRKAVSARLQVHKQRREMGSAAAR